jgi:hypothetical protein
MRAVVRQVKGAVHITFKDVNGVPSHTAHATPQEARALGMDLVRAANAATDHANRKSRKSMAELVRGVNAHIDAKDRT